MPVLLKCSSSPSVVLEERISSKVFRKRATARTRAIHPHVVVKFQLRVQRVFHVQWACSIIHLVHFEKGNLPQQMRYLFVFVFLTLAELFPSQTQRI